MATQQTLNFNYIEDVPSSNWKTPKTLPDLVDSTVIALDTETYDPHLLERGPGWDIGDGYICGVSVSVSKQATWYLPIGKNGFIIEEVVDWLQDTFTKDVTMVGANLMYDLGWLQHAGFKTQCKLFDIQFVEALLNEHRDGYSLDSLAEQYGYGGKHSSDLYQWCANNFGGIVSDRQRANIYRAPVSLVGPYAEADAFLPLLIREQQLPQIVYQELQAVVDLEHGLIPMLLAMRKRGVRVDMKARDELSKYIGQRLAKAFVVSKDIAGRVVNVNAANDIAKVFDANGWEYPLLPPTPKQKARAEITGLPIPPKPSFIKAWLQAQHDNPFALAVADLRGLDKLKGTFVDGYFKLVRDGRMHGCIHPLRTGANGTVSGRMSCSKANLTNIPARDPEFGPRIRGLFLPDEGEDWVSMDYSQIELKFLAHYALGKGAKETRKLMNDDPTVDFHQMVMDKTGLGRKESKGISFSLCASGDQLVLTNTGRVFLKDVTDSHLVWDGVEFVSHEGLIYKGEKEVMIYDGLKATPDHIVWTESGEQITLEQAAHKHLRLMRTGDRDKPLEHRLITSDKRAHEAQKGREELVFSEHYGVYFMREGTMLPCGVSKKGKEHKLPLPKRFLPRHTSEVARPTVPRYCSALRKDHTFCGCRLPRARYQERVHQPKRVRYMGTREMATRVFCEQTVRSYRQRRALLQGESAAGYTFGELVQPTQYCHVGYTGRSHYAREVMGQPLRCKRYSKAYQKRSVRKSDTGSCHCGCEKATSRVPKTERMAYSTRIHESRRLGKPLRQGTYKAMGTQRVKQKSDHRESYSWCNKPSTRTPEAAKMVGKARVYDLLNAGPRHRFTVSNVLVSNCYGSGVANTAELLGCSMDEARAFREKHFAGMPFMKETFDECTHVANTRGYLFTIMGRRARFPFWEANKYRLPEGNREEAEELGLFDSREACQRAVDDLVGMDIGTTSFVQRAKTYKALNSLLQGSAADMMKKAMLDIWNSGVCDVLGAPLNVVHDELNWSVPKTALGNEAAREAQHLMNNALKLKVPVTTSFERGNDWGHLKKEE